MDDGLHMAHFGSPPHGAGETIAFPPALLAPINMRVDLQDGEGAVFAEGFDEGNGCAVIAADHDGHGTGIENFCRGLANEIAVAGTVIGQGADIPQIAEAEITPAVERSAQIKIPMVFPVGILGQSSAQGLGGILMHAVVDEGIGRAVRGTEKHGLAAFWAFHMGGTNKGKVRRFVTLTH